MISSARAPSPPRTARRSSTCSSRVLEKRVARRAVDLAVDLLVELHQLALVGELGRVQPLQQVSDRLPVIGAAALRGEPCRMPLEDDPHLCDPCEVCDVHVRDERAAVRHAANQVFPREALQGFPDRRAADLELVAEPALLNHRSGRHVEAHDAVSYPPVGFLALRARAVRDRALRAPYPQRASLRSQPPCDPSPSTDRYATDIPARNVAPPGTPVKWRA